MTEEQRYQALEQERQNALDNSNKTYDDLLKENSQYSDSVKQYLEQYQQQQNDVYDKQTQFQVDLQNQNKEKAEREFQKEAQASKNAYYDFINPYGIQREIQAQNGLNGSGYSETTKSQAWTTQQNRTAQARASMNEAKLQFDNAIKEAYLNNDVNKAQLALEILRQQQEEALRSFNYRSDTQQNRLTNNQSLDSEYNNRYNTLYDQIQQEKAAQEAIRQWEAEMAEKQRQYNESLAWQKEQARMEQERWEKEYALSKSRSISTSGGGNLTNSNPVVNLSDSNKSVTPFVGGLGIGGITVFNQSSNQNLYNANQKLYSAKQTPRFSSPTGASWYNQNFGTKQLTASQIESMLQSGLRGGVITQNEAETILQNYGL